MASIPHLPLIPCNCTICLNKAPRSRAQKRRRKAGGPRPSQASPAPRRAPSVLPAHACKYTRAAFLLFLILPAAAARTAPALPMPAILLHQDLRLGHVPSPSSKAAAPRAHESPPQPWEKGKSKRGKSWNVKCFEHRPSRGEQNQHQENFPPEREGKAV